MANSHDVPRLAIEAEILERLIHKLKIMTLESLQANVLFARLKTQKIPSHRKSKCIEMIKYKA